MNNKNSKKLKENIMFLLFKSARWEYYRKNTLTTVCRAELIIGSLVCIIYLSTLISSLILQITIEDYKRDFLISSQKEYLGIHITMIIVITVIGMILGIIWYRRKIEFSYIAYNHNDMPDMRYDYNSFAYGVIGKLIGLCLLETVILLFFMIREETVYNRMSYIIEFAVGWILIMPIYIFIQNILVNKDIKCFITNYSIND